jgi:hypothetical protein
MPAFTLAAAPRLKTIVAGTVALRGVGNQPETGQRSTALSTKLRLGRIIGPALGATMLECGTAVDAEFCALVIFGIAAPATHFPLLPAIDSIELSLFFPALGFFSSVTAQSSTRAQPEARCPLPTFFLLYRFG